MPINPNIAMGVNPLQLQLPDPNQGMNALARALQIKNAMSEGDMQAMKLDEYKRGIEDQNALRAGLSAPDADPYKVLLSRGKVKEATDFAKSQADIGKAKTETDAKAVETAHKRIDGWGQVMGFVRHNPTPQNASAAVQYLVNMGLMPKEQAQAALAGVNPSDPQGIAQWATMGFQAALSAKDQLPKYDTRNLGGTTQMTAVDPVTGQVRVVNSAQNTQSPDNKASVGAQYAIAQSNRDAASINAQATRDAATIKDRRDTEMKLADDYRGQSKNFKEATEAYKQLNATLGSATTSAAATLAAATKFMKQLDPGSVVRESELGMALAATGVLDRAANYVNVLKNGKTLTPSQAADFKRISAQIFAASQKVQKDVDAFYTKQAGTYGLRPDTIVQDLGQNAAIPSEPVDINALPSGGGQRPTGRGNSYQWKDLK